MTRETQYVELDTYEALLAERDSLKARLDAVVARHQPFFGDEYAGWICYACREMLTDDSPDCATVRAARGES